MLIGHRLIASVSPDGRTLLSVGDSSKVYLHSITGGARITFSPITTLTVPASSSSSPSPLYSDVYSYLYSTLPASFSTSFSSDGTKFAVASQEGVVVVWDVRSSKPLKAYESNKNRGSGAERPRRQGNASGWLGNDAWDWARFGSLAPGWGFRNVKFSPAGSGKELITFIEVRLEWSSLYTSVR
jgi:WD40 repeat protein